MQRTAVAVLIVLSVLGFAAYRGSLVLARMDDSVHLFGYSLRLQLAVELTWNSPQSTGDRVNDPSHILPDTLEVP